VENGPIVPRNELADLRQRNRPLIAVMAGRVEFVVSEKPPLPWPLVSYSSDHGATGT